MKFIYIFLAALAATCGPVYAQIGYGPEIGGGLSSMHFAPPTSPIAYTQASTNAIASGKIGGLIDIPLNKHIYFQAGLSVSRKGVARAFSYYINDSFNESVNQTLYINYFDVPVNIIFKTGMQGRGRFIAGIGATPSYIIGGRNKLQDHLVYNDTPSFSNTNEKIATGQTIAGFDIGLNLTAGYELPTGLFFRAYYTVGINDIGIGSEVDKNRMWGIAAGCLFGKGRNVNREADDLIDKTPGP